MCHVFPAVFCILSSLKRNLQEVGEAHSIIYGGVIIYGVTSRQEFTGPGSASAQWLAR